MTPGLIAAAAVLCGFSAARATSRPRILIGERSHVSSVSGRHRQTRRRDRSRAVHGEVPHLLDLLAAGSTAGLSAELSFRQAVDCLRGPLADDLAGVVRRVDLGAPWRTEMANYVASSGNRDLARTMTVLARSETLGVSLRDATRELAASVREAHRAELLERARSAPVKMLFPLVLLILPAFLLLTVVPVLITTVRTI